MCKSRRCKAMMDEGDDAAWWLRPKEEDAHTNCSFAQGHVDSDTRTKKKKSPDTNDTCTFLFLQWKDGMSQRKSGRNHSAVMMRVQQWNFGVIQMLFCLERQQRVMDLGVEEFVCTSVSQWPVLGINNGRHCLMSKQMTHWSALSACSNPEGSYLTVGAIKAAEWTAQWGERQESQMSLK